MRNTGNLALNNPVSVILFHMLNLLITNLPNTQSADDNVKLIIDVKIFKTHLFK